LLERLLRRLAHDVTVVLSRKEHRREDRFNVLKRAGRLGTNVGPKPIHQPSFVDRRLILLQRATQRGAR
jgi:hypothetical protein